MLVLGSGCVWFIGYVHVLVVNAHTVTSRCAFWPCMFGRLLVVMLNVRNITSGLWLCVVILCDYALFCMVIT